METLQKKKKLPSPSLPVIMFIAVIFVCLATYIIPAGVYDTFADGTIDPDSFHFIENTPISPFNAFGHVHTIISNNGLVIALLLILGASTQILGTSGAIGSLIDSAVDRFQDKSVAVLVPAVFFLMMVLGALAGNDSMIAYIAIGITICKKLKLDRLCAVGMIYLAFITGMAAGPTTGILLFAQGLLGIAPMSGLGIRLVTLVAFYIVGAILLTRYAVKISKDPSKSLLGEEGLLRFTPEEQAIEDARESNGKIDMRALFSVMLVILSYVLYAVGAKVYSWSWDELCSCILGGSILIAIVYRMSPNKIAKELMTGAGKMGAICFLIGLVGAITYTLTNGNIMHTISYYAIQVMSGFGSVGTAIALFVFMLCFNMLISGGFPKIQIVVPIVLPMAAALGLSEQVMSMSIQFGDGLTNCITPMSSVMMGALAIGGLTYGQWFKFVYKFVLCNIAIAAVAIAVAQMMGM